jgi:hypothetical protein
MVVRKGENVGKRAVRYTAAGSRARSTGRSRSSSLQMLGDLCTIGPGQSGHRPWGAR